MNYDGWCGNAKVAEWILNIGVQSTIILIVSLFLRRACAKCSPPTRSNICFMTMLVLLVLPIGLFVLRDFSPVKIEVNRPSTSIESPELQPSDTAEINPALRQVAH